jgi:hypothetical protein
MKHFSGYGAYLLFLALRTHFTKTKYDFFQMHGKLRANKESYLKRNDKLFFEKIAKRYNAEELKNFYVANLLEDRHYITDMLDEDAHGTFFDYEKRRQALTYNFKNDIDSIFKTDSVSAPFKLSMDTYPDIITLRMRNIITWETSIILNDFIPYVEKFDKYLEDDIIWNRMSLKLHKYKPFVKYDKNKYKHILRERIDELTVNTR